MNAFLFQNLRDTNYFEGFYVRFFDREHTVNIACIFAVTFNEEDPHAFLQVFDGLKRENRYHRYPLSAFSFENGVLTLENNTLTTKGMKIDTETCKLSVEFTKKTSPPHKSAMGFLRKFPLQCHQDVIFINGEGEATFQREDMSLKVRGKVYMETTYGKSFPRRWLWLQANAFKASNASLSVAGGSVPFLCFQPFAFFVLLTHKNKTYRFATYNASTLKISQEHGTMKVTVRKGRLRLELFVSPSQATTLLGPSDDGKMDREVYETLDAKVALTLKKGSTILLEDKAEHAGLEWML